jgi:N-acetylglucosamine repressor
LLELRQDSYYSVGLDVDVDSILFILMDITGKVIYEGTASLTDNAPQATAQTAAACIKELISKCSIDRERLLGIGVSVPGMVDAVSHRIVLAPNLGWEDVDFGVLLSEQIGLPVYIENEAMASAICENWLGACRSDKNFVCVNIKSGIGAGIFTGGKPYRGADGSAGEVGHVVVDENGTRCGCGNFGCLETVASTGRIIDKARKMADRGVSSSLSRINNTEDIRLDDIAQAAREGDEAAKGLLNEAAGYLGIALSNLVNTLNPSKIVLGKNFTVYGDLVMETIRGVVSRKALKRPASGVEIIASEIGERVSTLGAAIVPLKLLFGR